MTEREKIENFESRDKQLIEEILNEIDTHKGTIAFTLRQAIGKIDQSNFEKVIMNLRSDLNNMVVRAINETGGVVDNKSIKTGV